MTTESVARHRDAPEPISPAAAPVTAPDPPVTPRSIWDRIVDVFEAGDEFAGRFVNALPYILLWGFALVVALFVALGMLGLLWIGVRAIF